LGGRQALNNVCFTKKRNTFRLLYKAFVYFKLGAERDGDRKTRTFI